MSEEVNRKCPPLPGTRRYNFQAPAPTLSATVHSVTDRQTNRRHYDAKSRADHNTCSTIS